MCVCVWGGGGGGGGGGVIPHCPSRASQGKTKDSGGCGWVSVGTISLELAKAKAIMNQSQVGVGGRGRQRGVTALELAKAVKSQVGGFLGVCVGEDV